MSDPHVRTDRSAQVLAVELARPGKRNAITQGMYAAMSEAFDEAGSDDGVGAVLLHGQPDCFTAGNDLADFLEPRSRKDGHGHRFLHAIAGCPKPIVAAVGGPAIGIGTTMLLHCDLVLAGEGARFQLPFVPLGLCPEAGSSMLLPQMAGPRLAAELMLLGDPFDAARAREAGIVNSVVPDSDLLPRARSLAERLAAQPRAALLATKALLRRPQGRAVPQAIEDEYPDFERLLASEEARSIVRAFLARRVLAAAPNPKATSVPAALEGRTLAAE